MREKSLDAILETCDLTEPQTRLKDGVTVCLPDEYKTKYRELQKRTGRKFAGTLREIAMAVIDRAYVKAG
jgi:hypothetical protein